MRFFSNDARESEDDQARDDRPDRIQSDPVAVPNQRPPSPWSNTPTATDDTVDGDIADERRADTPATATATATVDTDADRPAFSEPSAFGGSTVDAPVTTPAADTSSGNMYASSTATRDDVDLPLDGTSSPTADSDSADREPVSTGTDELKDDDVEDPKAVDTVDSPSDLDTADSRSDLDPAADSPADEDTSTVDDHVSAVDAPDDDSTPSDSTPGDKAADDEAAVEDKAVVDDASVEDKDDAAVEDKAVDDDASVDDEPVAVADTATPEADAVDTPDEEPVVVPVPVGAGMSAPAAKAETLFGADNAQSFQDRWRDVQLRFVDSPKDAAADAAKLIDEAVEKITAALKAQRDTLTSDTEDTEELRVQLRGYRDILNRIVAL